MRRSHSGRAMAGQRVKENPLETAVPRSRPHRANVYRRRASLQRRESTNSSFNPFGRDSHAHLDNSPISLTLDDTNYQVATPSEHTSQIHTFTTAQKSAQELSLTKVAKGVKENALTGRGIRMSSGNADKPCLNPALLIDGECGTTSDSWQSLHDADIQNPSGMLLDSIIESGEYITSLENTKDDSVARQAVSDAAEELELRTEASNIILSTANAISFLAKVTEKTVNTDSQLSSISRTSTNSSTMNGFDNQFYSMGSTERLFSGRSESTANNETDMDYTQDISLFAGVSSFPANDMVSPAVDDTAFCTWIPDKFDFDDIIDASEYVFATNFRDAELNQNMKSEQDVTPIADSV
ncbi:hypothetical protein SARC_07635 [Sphaeroforma arctica JP610]|uniref:Uncharacterized protein n=1 Tax=Sphaeroforma arctica JP610 TaxID=667725 RepID=A0A0L0FT83_9EUKA|nr:hypothetical protein SARC_07635 [Sphaeroforma arctica JP610]KNC79992.1 hypothetical protein SARC_07635 [Sphaeroforma arctica JP610]|eukprot:XP_014153894.1 hypothetical protein SARC_07635 [Sphaeroforma arctica JP610]